MSWEVSSMPSKRSFFNRTLFRKNLSRSWPLWGLLSLAGAMIPLYFLLEAARFPAAAMTSGDFASGLYQAVTIFAPGFTACYAILCAMLVWGYLYNPRAVSLFHALPVDRTCLFATNVLSGLVMIAVPYAVTGGLICLVAAGWGFLDMIAVVNTTAAVVCLAAAFFGLATLCAMLTGVQTCALPICSWWASTATRCATTPSPPSCRYTPPSTAAGSGSTGPPATGRRSSTGCG